MFNVRRTGSCSKWRQHSPDPWKWLADESRPPAGTAEIPVEITGTPLRPGIVIWSTAAAGCKVVMMDWTVPAGWGCLEMVRWMREPGVWRADLAGCLWAEEGRTMEDCDLCGGGMHCRDFDGAFAATYNETLECQGWNFRDYRGDWQKREEDRMFWKCLRKRKCGRCAEVFV